MVGHDERDDQDQQRWHARFAKERRGLSVSVNEALAAPLLEEDFDDELQDEYEPMPPASQKMLIAPRLSLQSKPMPAVHIVPDKLDRPQQVDPSPETNHVEALPAAPKKKRLAGRNTKVHLQAVPKTEKRSAKKMASSPGIINSTIVEQDMPAIALSLPETRTSEHVTERPIAVSLKKDESLTREKLAGSGQNSSGAGRDDYRKFACVRIERGHDKLARQSRSRRCTILHAAAQFWLQGPSERACYC